MHALARGPATAALLCSLSGAGAHAASFDCKSARTPIERSICGSPRLSALDGQLAREYERALHALSAAGAARLRDSQRHWLRFASAVCAPRAPGGDGDDASRCLAQEYERRLGQLVQAGFRVGPYVFNRIDRYDVRPSPDGDGSGYHNGYVTQHAGFPQIDSPVTAATNAWNAQQHQDLPSVEADDDTDNDVDVTLGCVGTSFISVEKVSEQYGHGTPHGVFDREKGNAILAPGLRDMTEDDVFAEDSGWEQKLPDLFWNAYVNGPRRGEGDSKVEAAIRGSAADAGAWLFTPAGLQISFGAYEAGCYACNPGPITVPWSALKPMLASPEFAACQAPAAARR